MKMHVYLSWDVQIAVTLSIMILFGVGTSTSISDAVGNSGGLSANSVKSANVTAHTIGNTSKLKSGGLSANSLKNSS